MRTFILANGVGDFADTRECSLRQSRASRAIVQRAPRRCSCE